MQTGSRSRRSKNASRRHRGQINENKDHPRDNRGAVPLLKRSGARALPSEAAAAKPSQDKSEAEPVHQDEEGCGHVEKKFVNSLRCAQRVYN